MGDEIGGNDELLEVEIDGFVRRNEKLQVYRVLDDGVEW